MQETLRSLVSATIGGLVVAAVVVGQPAVADQLDKSAAKNSVTSKSIKNATIKTKDLSAEVTGPLAKAGTALQSIPDNGVTNPKLADDAVGSAEVAPNSLTAQDLGDNSVGGNEITGNAVSSAEVNNRSLVLADLAAADGQVSRTFGNLAAGACDSFVVDTNINLANDIVLASGDYFLPAGWTVSARIAAVLLTQDIEIVVCNDTASALDPVPAVNFTWAVLKG